MPAMAPGFLRKGKMPIKPRHGPVVRPKPPIPPRHGKPWRPGQQPVAGRFGRNVVKPIKKVGSKAC